MSTTSATVHRVAVDDVPSLESKAWRDDLLAELAAGARLVTLYGKRVDDRVTVTAVLRSASGALRVSRTVATAQFGYHELTTTNAAFHCFERELHEQTGLRIAGHPWLKPVRYEGREQSSMKGHPYYKIAGKEVHEVAVGPIHAGVIEPGSFRFMCHGEQVHHLEIQLGYQHRGVESLLLRRDPCRLAPLVETIAGDTSVGHAWACCAALESLSDCEPGLGAEVSRAIFLELERVAMHLASLSGLAADMGFLQGATTYGRLRTIAINTTMRLCGSRFGRTAVVPGGVGYPVTAASLDAVAASVRTLREDLAIINECFLESRTVQHRLREVGVLTEAQARSLGVVGLAARASGIAEDLRSTKSGAYALGSFATATRSEGDCWARACVRIAELDASLAWLATTVEAPLEWVRPRETVGDLAPAQLVVSLIEGWRGEVVHCMETGDDGVLVHYKVQDPSLRNWMGLAVAVRGNEISDFPICNKSFDLSYCGNDL